MNDLQKSLLGILIEVIHVCDKHGLRYYAIGGTLLGAVRHSGFIPWDDDIDIGMPRPDYDRFLNIANSELSNNLYATSYKDQIGSSHPIFICQVKNDAVRVRIEYAQRSEVTSAWVDIAPLDAMPSNVIMRWLHKYRLLYLRMKTKFALYDVDVHQHRANRPLLERLLMGFREATKLGENWNPFTLYEDLERSLKKYNYDSEDYLISIMGAYKLREMFPKSWFGDGERIRFETIELNCPDQYQKVLCQMYGDYLVPPPDDQKPKQHCLSVIRTDSLDEGVSLV